MISILIDFLKSGLDFFIKKKTIEQEVKKKMLKGRLKRIKKRLKR